MTETSPIKAVVFDVGAVLLEWDPRHLYRRIFTGADGAPDTDRIEWFLQNICVMAWNIEQDRGRSIADANAELIGRHPDLKVEIEAYYGRFQEMIPGPITGTVDCMERLQAAGMPVYGLTNYGRETFAETRARFDFLNQFDGVVVSGEERLIKPDPRIFELLCERFDLVPATSFFTDDNPANIAAARELGFHAHLFEGPDGLNAALAALGLP